MAKGDICPTIVRCPCQCGFGTDFGEILQGVTATISGFGIGRGIEFLVLRFFFLGSCMTSLYAVVRPVAWPDLRAALLLCMQREWCVCCQWERPYFYYRVDALVCHVLLCGMKEDMAPDSFGAVSITIHRLKRQQQSTHRLCDSPINLNEFGARQGLIFYRFWQARR